MKRFLCRIILFAFPFLTVAALLEVVVERIPNSYTYKRAYMECNASRIRTLILGSSYAYDGLNPSVMPDAFNLANSSQTPEDDYRLLARYIDQMDSLDRVIIGVGYGTWADVTEKNRRTYYTVYMGLYPRWPLNRYSYEVFNPELLVKKVVKYMLSRDVTRCDSLGQREGHSASARASMALLNKDTEQLVRNDRIDLVSSREAIARNVAWLQRTTALCQAHKVLPVVVAMPCQQVYRDALPAEQIQLQDSILTTLPCVIDASAWSVSPDGWYNATHLTKEESVGFTRRLTDSIPCGF